jgi:hypothetical protein
MIDAYQISYVGCGRDVLRFGAQSTGRPADPLVVADPDFDLVVQSPDRLTDPTAHAIAIRDLMFMQPFGGWFLAGQSTGSARSGGEADPDFDLVVQLPDPRTDPIAHALAIRDLAFMQLFREWSLAG